MPSAAISSTKRLQTSAKKIYFQFAECSYIFYKEIANECKENLFSFVGA